MCMSFVCIPYVHIVSVARLGLSKSSYRAPVWAAALMKDSGHPGTGNACPSVAAAR